MTVSKKNPVCVVVGVGPGNGTIFFVDYNDQYSGFNFLEAAPAGCETTLAWSSNTTAVGFNLSTRAASAGIIMRLLRNPKLSDYEARL